MKSLSGALMIALVATACRDARTPADPDAALLGAALAPIANPGGPYLSAGTVRFDGSASTDLDGDAVVGYAWDFGDGNTGSGVAPTHTYAADGLYAVTLTVRDATGAASLPGVTAATVTNSAAAPVLLTGAGNIAKCTLPYDEATASLLDGVDGWVMALGDNAFPDGTLTDYLDCYDPTWGRHRSRTFPVPGNHEYDTGAADGYFDYFGARAGSRGLGYYSVDVGDWHVIVLNDNRNYVSIAAGSPQDQWLVNDLAANRKACTIALWHVPLFLSSNTAGYTTNPSRKILWDRLDAAGADLIVNGQEHHYERMAPMRPDGTRDDAAGMRQITVGTGGESVELPTVSVHPNSEVRGAGFGVLKLTLRAGGYDWQFVPVAGESFTDAGSGTCR